MEFGHDCFLQPGNWGTDPGKLIVLRQNPGES